MIVCSGAIFRQFLLSQDLLFALLWKWQSSTLSWPLSFFLLLMTILCICYNFKCALILGRYVKSSFDSWKGVENACSDQIHITTNNYLPASKLHWFDFALLFVIKCVIKLPAQEDAKSPWLHLFSVCPMFYLKWVLKSPVREDA